MSDQFTVLCVDDEQFILNAVRRAFRLSDLNIALHMAKSGSEAIDILSRHECDVVLVDLIMPQMGGIEVLLKIKQMFPLTEVVILTADTSPAAVVSAMKAGAADYLTKPIDKQRLLTTTQNLIEKRRLAMQNLHLLQALRERRSSPLAHMPIRVMIVDDVERDRSVLSQYLSEVTSPSMELVEAACGQQALAKYREQRADCVLLSLELPDATAMEMLQSFREESGILDIAVVVLAKQGKEEDAVEAMKNGAMDYMIKDRVTRESVTRAVVRAVEKNEMIRTVRRQEEEKRFLIEELERNRESLVHEAAHDPLTGALNRRAIMNRILEEFSRKRRSQTNLTIAMCDIDHFKLVNDTYGHQTGDDVLCGFVDRIQSGLREHDSFGRYGGEEFLLLISDDGYQNEPYERVCRAIAEAPFPTRLGNIHITVSIGVANALGSVEETIAVADEALYRAKQEGRNRVIWAPKK